MGRSFTSDHILNSDKLTKAQFKKKFTDMMKAKGYTKTDVDEAELSYALAFSPDRKWVTVLTEDSENSQNKTADFAKLLGMEVLDIELVDSDFAELTLFDKTGTQADIMFLGDPYFDEVPEPSPLKWQTLLGVDWSEVEKLQNTHYIFAEEALGEFAVVIGMDRENILLEYDEVDDSAERLYFKKAGERKLTLNAAFKKYFGELLEPMRFVYKTINKRPYYIRLINNEILQFLTFSQLPMTKVGYKSFDMKYYITPLYRKELPDLISQPNFYDLGCVRDLLEDPIAQFGLDYSKKVIEILSDLYWVHNPVDWSKIPDEQLERFINDRIWRFDFQYSPEYFKGIELAKEYVEKLVIPLFESVTDVEQCIDYYYSNMYGDIKSIELDAFNDRINSYNVSLMLVLADYKKDISKYIDKKVEKKIYQLNHGSGLAGAKDIDDYVARFRQKQEDMIAIRDKILDTPELKERALKMAEEFRENNLEVLRSYGLKI